MLPEPISRAFAHYGIPAYGACRFADSLPLLDCRASQRIPEHAQTILTALFPYRLPSYSPWRNLSKYAVVPDYHRVALGLLNQVCVMLLQHWPGESFAAFADNSPIREVRAAYLSGLGVVGDNGLLFHPVYGSYVFIGEIVTTLAIEPGIPMGTGCLHCGACSQRCPGRAIQSGGVCAARCVSHITQKKGELTREEQALVKQGGLLWGCDVCSDICPMNRGSSPTNLPEFLRDIEEAADLTRTARTLRERAYGFRGKAVLERNAAILGECGGENPL